ncbi:MAG: hypothetical protein GHCLOJNM_02984 [bacterium]|nr:hypothetical protein [bacterium]
MMSRHSLKSCLVFVLFMGVASGGHAAPPIINYQGRLTDASGNTPITSAVTLTFSFFSTATGGTPLGPNNYSYEIVATPNSQGFVSVLIGGPSGIGGSIPKSIFSSDTVYLNVNVKTQGMAMGENLSPRILLESVPYSFYSDNAAEASHAVLADNAAHADSADNATHADDASQADSADSATQAQVAGTASSLSGPGGSPGDVLTVDAGGEVSLNDGKTLTLKSSDMGERVHLGVDENDHGEIRLRNSSGQTTLHLDGGGLQPDAFSRGEILVTNAQGYRRVLMGTQYSAMGDYNYGYLALFSSQENSLAGGLVELRESPGTAGRGGQVVIHYTGANGGERVGVGVNGNGDGEIYLLNSSQQTIQLNATNGTVNAIDVVETSDAALKENVEDIDGALEKILELRGVSFDWKSPDYPEGAQLGLIAQEVERVYPELVHEGTNGYKALDYSKLMAPMIEALKEMNAKVEQQAAQIDSLRRNIEEMRGE